MGKSKQDTKSADKGSGSKGGKGKGKGDDDKDTKSSKGAQSINVRHILVCLSQSIHGLPRLHDPSHEMLIMD